MRHMVGYTAEQHPLEPSQSAAAQHKKVCFLLLGKAQNDFIRMSDFLMIGAVDTLFFSEAADALRDLFKELLGVKIGVAVGNRDVAVPWQLEREKNARLKQRQAQSRAAPSTLASARSTDIVCVSVWVRH